jgi:hypothetical protein
LSSARWQRDFAEDLIEGRGSIVAKFFDVGCSRRLEWSERPQAALLLNAIVDLQRPFDAIVVGEFERAFYGDQFLRLAPLFDRYRVEVWLPELDGPVDVGNELHLSLLALLGVHSRREVLRSRFRAKAAMQAQVALQGRHVGGRPPYGYQLVDAGPHPNARHAHWGRRAHRLEPDPLTAPHVQWIFAQRLSGRSVAGIARDRSPAAPGICWSTRMAVSPKSLLSRPSNRTGDVSGSPATPLSSASPTATLPRSRLRYASSRSTRRRHGGSKDATASGNGPANRGSTRSDVSASAMTLQAISTDGSAS